MEDPPEPPIIAPVAEKPMIIYYDRTPRQMMELRAKWMKMPAIQYAIVAYLGGRETAFLSPSRDFGNIRHCKVHNVAYLNSNFHAFDYINKDFNLYYSLASFRDLPMFSYNPSVREKQQKTFSKEIQNYVTGFDFVLDFDAHGTKFKSHKKSQMWRDCKTVIDDFDKYRVKYSLKFSGNGFHVRVPYEQFKNEAGSLREINFGEPGNVFYWCKKVRERLVDFYGLSTVDMRLVEIARIWKAEWSYVVPYGTIARPLSREMFDSFDLEIVNPLELLKLPFMYWNRKSTEWCNEGESNGFLQFVKKRLKHI